MRDCPFPVLLMLLSLSIMLIGMALVIDDNDFGVLMMEKQFPKLLQTKRKLNNSYETEIDFYFYNITNPIEVERGNKAKTEPVGPFRYVKNFIQTNEFNKDKTIHKFRLQSNYHLVGENKVKITTFNGPKLITTNLLGKLPQLMQETLAIMITLQEPSSLVTKTANEILFGYDDPLLLAANAYFGELFFPGIQFGYFLPQNQTSIDLSVKIDNIENFGNVLTFNGEPVKEPNATLGLTFAPIINQTQITVFDPFLCQSLTYTLNETEPSFVTDNHKYTSDFDKVDISQCIQSKFGHAAPITISQPKGHKSYIKVDPITGIVYKRLKRYKLSLVDKPILWFEERTMLKLDKRRNLYWNTILPFSSIVRVSRYLYLASGITFMIMLSSMLWPLKSEDRLPGDYDFYNQVYASSESDQSLIDNQIEEIEEDCETRVQNWLASGGEYSDDSLMDESLPTDIATPTTTVTEEILGQEESPSPPKNNLRSLVRHWEILSQDQIQISRTQNRSRSTGIWIIFKLAYFYRARRSLEGQD